MSDLPPGFELEVADLPEGFELEVADLPEGFELEDGKAASKPEPTWAAIVPRATEGFARNTYGAGGALVQAAGEVPAPVLTDDPAKAAQLGGGGGLLGDGSPLPARASDGGGGLAGAAGGSATGGGVPAPTYDTGERVPVAPGLAAAGRNVAVSQRQAVQELRAGIPDGSAKGLAFDVATNAPQILIPAAVGLVNPAAGVELGSILAGGTATGNRYDELRNERGLSAADARQGAGIAGVTELLTEKLALGQILKIGGRAGLRNALKRVAVAAGAEGAQEAVAQAVEEGYNAGVLGDDVALGDALGRVGYASLVGAIIGGGARGGIEAVDGARGRAAETNDPAPSRADPSFDAARGQMAEQDGAIVAPSGAVLGPEADARKAWAQASQEERAAWLSGSEDGEADQAAMLDQVSSQGSTPVATGSDLENFGNEDLPADVVRREFLTENGYIEGGDGSISTKDGPVAGPELDQLMTFLADADDVTQQMEAEGLLVTPQTVREELRRRQRVLDLQGDLATAQTPEAKAIVQKQIDAASAGRTAPAGDLEALAKAAEARGDKEVSKAYRESIKEIVNGGVADRSGEGGSADVAGSLGSAAGAGSVPTEPESAPSAAGTSPAGATPLAVEGGASEQVAGVGDQEPISVLDPEWAEFAPETGTLAVPRAEMPQIKAEHRGAMVNFLNARGVSHEIERDVDPAELKPTQAEFSKAKVEQARSFQGGDRAILVSSDGHVVDGHHQWLAAAADGKPIKVIKLDAPARDLLPLLNEFPSSLQDAGLPDAGSVSQPEPVDPKYDLSHNLPKNTRVGDAEAITGLASAAATTKTLQKDSVRYAVVDPVAAGKLKEATGLDVEGYRHSIDNFAVRHALREHGDEKAEAKRGQQAIKPEDFAKIPDIVQNYDAVQLVGKDATGNDLLRYEKRYNGSVYYVEEVRNGRHELVAKTLWKTRSRVQLPSSNESTNLRPERFGGNLPQRDGSVAPNDPAEKALPVRVARGTKPGDSSSFTQIGSESQTDPGVALEPGNEKTVAPNEPVEQEAAPKTGQEGSDTAARRSSAEASAADVNQAQRIVDAITATWANKPTIKVIASMQDQEAPEAARRMDAEQKAGGAIGEVGGFIYRNEVYINAAASADPRQIVRTLYHEALGHFGLRAVFGPQMAEELKRVVFLRAKDVKAKLLEYGMPDNAENRLKAAEEVLARLAETDPKLPLVQRVLAAIRSFLRPILSKLGITLELSDAELIRDYLIPARNYVRRSSTPETLGGELAFSRADDQGEKVAILRKAVEQVANGAEEAVAVGLRPDLVALGGSPDVAISWGNAKYGLSKIGARRGTEVVGKVLRAVALGAIERHSDAKKTVLLAHEGGRAVLSLDENGKRKTWLLTGWEEGRPDAAGEVRTQSGATQTDPTFGRADLVAGLDEMLPPSSDDDNAAVDFSRNEPDQPSFTEENRRIREEHRGLWIKGKQFLRRQLLPGGLLPEAVFKEKMVRDNESQAIEFDIRHIVGNLDKMLMKDYGRRFDSLSMADQKKLMDGLAGKLDPSIPEGTSTALVAMRQYIDAQSTEYVDILQKKLDAKLADDPDSKDAKLIETIKGNFGNYVHRSYRAFDDAQWFRKVTDPTINAARDYLIGRYVESGASQAEAKRVAEVTLNEILKTGTAYESLDAFISEGKLGAKDLSVLIKRKQIAPQIRALLGEYIDPRISFTKSATKMGRLIWNQRFLDRVREVGVGSFLFEGKDRPPEATAQLAAEGSEAYAPLNGLWTTPDVKQAFVDALGKPGKENGIYTAAVAMTSLVKYGKTVLSPTTAARNWQSAMFFSLANGHFDLSQMSKSIAAFREQVSQNANAGQLVYLRKLKVLGVVYDTAQAGEMMDRIRDAKLEFWLKTRTGGLLRSVTKANDIARGFYSFGDDFWKIIGFENEKASLIKAGLPEAEAEKEAAERIRNTYPTYSLVGRGVKALGRFPLIGTFVSFPSEIIRTTSNMLRYTAKDLRSDNPKMRLNGAKRMVGMALVSAGFYALGAYTKALFGIDDDEEEAVRDLAPPWQKNSTFLYVGRDDKGNLRYFDLSFLDPYGYLKRPLTAMMRDQPWEDAAASGLWDMLSPFLGTDITTGAVMEVVTNKKESGGPVYRKFDTFGSQTADISEHLGKALAPGFVLQGWKILEAARGQKKASGQPFNMEDELSALAGWRASTVDAKVALYYRTFEFNDAISDARKALTEVIKDPNAVTDEDIKEGYDSAFDLQRRAFVSMRRVMAAAQKSGMTKRQVNETLSASGVSSGRVFDLINDRVPRVEFSDQAERDMINRTRLTKGKEAADEVRRRYGIARKLARQPQTSTRP